MREVRKSPEGVLRGWRSGPLPGTLRGEGRVDAGKLHLCPLQRLDSHSGPYGKLPFPSFSHPESLPLFSVGRGRGEDGGRRGRACGAPPPPPGVRSPV